MNRPQASEEIQPSCIIAGKRQPLAIAIAERYSREGFAVYLCDVLGVRSLAAAFETGVPHGRDCEVAIYLARFSLHAASPVAFVRLAAEAMRRHGRGAIFFLGAAPALVDRIAQELEPSGVRVATVTIDGAIPTSRAAVASIAALYWRLFIDSERVFRREVRWPG